MTNWACNSKKKMERKVCIFVILFNQQFARNKWNIFLDEGFFIFPQLAYYLYSYWFSYLMDEK